MEMPTEMQHQAMGYDRTATMFSPEGTILQVEYAEKTVRLGSSSIGIVCADGVFILADKRVRDKLVVKESASKVYEIDSNIIASVAGILADARVLIERAQVLSQQHRVTYDTEIEPELIIKDIANAMQQFTQYGGARPFGVSFMVAGLHGKNPELFSSDITGNYFGYHAHAIGENDEKLRERLREKYKKDLKIKEGVKIALEIFKEVLEDRFDLNRFELVVLRIGNDRPEKYEAENIKDVK
ncbi:MAG: archaeal proteasome endopeptidase complex subunit alpha [Nanoarchaeota archaeon]